MLGKVCDYEDPKECQRRGDQGQSDLDDTRLVGLRPAAWSLSHVADRLTSAGSRPGGRLPPCHRSPDLALGSTQRADGTVRMLLVRVAVMMVPVAVVMTVSVVMLVPVTRCMVVMVVAR